MNRILTAVVGATLLLAGAGCGATTSTTTVAVPESATSVAAHAIGTRAQGHCTPAPKFGACRYERPAHDTHHARHAADPLCLVSATVIEARVDAGETLPDCIRAKQAARTSLRP